MSDLTENANKSLGHTWTVIMLSTAQTIKSHFLPLPPQKKINQYECHGHSGKRNNNSRISITGFIPPFHFAKLTNQHWFSMLCIIWQTGRFVFYQTSMSKFACCPWLRADKGIVWHLDASKIVSTLINGNLANHIITLLAIVVETDL